MAFVVAMYQYSGPNAQPRAQRVLVTYLRATKRGGGARIRRSSRDRNRTIR